MAGETNAKPGYKTTEFWLSFLAAIIGFVLASGVMDSAGEDSIWTKIVGGAVAVLTALGYQVSRTKAKSVQ